MLAVVAGVDVFAGVGCGACANAAVANAPINTKLRMICVPNNPFGSLYKLASLSS